MKVYARKQAIFVDKSQRAQSQLLVEVVSSSRNIFIIFGVSNSCMELVMLIKMKRGVI